MVNHYSSFPVIMDSACLELNAYHEEYNVCIKAIGSVILCSFGTSTEASAPAVLSFLKC